MARPLLDQRYDAWWAFVDHSKAHDKKTKDKKWLNISTRIASERQRSDLFSKWFALHILATKVGIPSQTALELTVRHASVSPSEPPRGDEIPF